MNAKYYDGTKLLSMKDLNGNTPEIYMVTTNRTGGKTTWFNRWAVKRFLTKGEKFCLVMRFNYELDDIANKFFRDINTLFFPGYVMESKSKSHGIYHNLYIAPFDATVNDVEQLEWEECGYAISLNSADQIKKISHLLSDTSVMIFDEFQSESNHYCADEVQKLISIHTSIARGQGKQVKYVPVIMISNPVSLINPYYVALGITDRLRTDTKFLKGNGFVLEQGYNETAAQAQISSGFNQAFADQKYVAYAAQNVYLNDNNTFIEKPSGFSTYVCTLRYENTDYGVRTYPESGIVYCDTNADRTDKRKLAVSTSDHGINYVMLRSNDSLVNLLRFYFDKGCFRFKNLKCKEAILKAISY